MRASLAVLFAVVTTLISSLPVYAATEGPPAEEALPVGLALAAIAGLIAFGYFFLRPWRATGARPDSTAAVDKPLSDIEGRS